MGKWNGEIPTINEDEVRELFAEFAPTVYCEDQYIDSEDCALRDWIDDITRTYPDRYDCQKMPSEVFAERHEYVSGYERDEDIAAECVAEYREQIRVLTAWVNEAICEVIWRTPKINDRLKAIWHRAKMRRLLDDDERRDMKIAAGFGIENAREALDWDNALRRECGINTRKHLIVRKSTRSKRR